MLFNSIPRKMKGIPVCSLRGYFIKLVKHF
jgi:hypothetical protein